MFSKKVLVSVFIAIVATFFFMAPVNAARYENLTVTNLTVDKTAIIHGLLQAAANTTGNVWYVDDSGSNGSGAAGKSQKTPFAGIDYAIGKTIANNGDFIIVMPGHAETITSAITCDVAGVTILGLGGPRAMPTITTATAIDMMTVTAADVTIANLEFAIPGIDAVTADINIAAAGCSVLYTKHHGSTTAKNKVDIITLTSAADDALLQGLRIYNTTVEVVGGIVFEGACSRVEVSHCMVQDAIGFTGGSISDEATALQLYIHDNVFSNAKVDTVVMEFGNNSTGVCMNNFANGRHTTIASNVAPGTGMAFMNNMAVEEAALNAILIPAADAE